MRSQRQAASRVESHGNPAEHAGVARPDSAASAARPNTANSFRPAGGPAAPRARSEGVERMEHIRSTFMLVERDVAHFYRAFCFVAKEGDFAPSPTRASPSGPRREKERGAASGPVAAEVSGTSPRRPWEEKAASEITLSLSDFFATFQLAHTPNGGFLDGVFDLVGTRDLHAMTFCEFLDGVCTFGMFKLEDMLKFVFFVLDKGKEGRIARFQLLRFVESIHAKKTRVFERVLLPAAPASPSRPKDSGDPLRLPAAERQRASVDYLALKTLCLEYPTLLEPLFLLQSSLRRRIAGEAWWRRKEGQIEKYFRTLGPAREKQRRREESKLRKERKRNIISEIGWLPYYLKHESRIEAETMHPKPIVSLEEETGEVCVEWTRTDGKNNDGSVKS